MDIEITKAVNKTGTIITTELCPLMKFSSNFE